MAPNHRSGSLSVEEAVELYLQSKEGEVRSSTLESYGYQLDRFVEFANDCGVEDTTGLSGRLLLDFKLRRQEDGINRVTMNTQLKNLQVFLEFLVKLDAVDSDLPEKVDVPTLTSEENARESFLPSETARTILDYYGKYEYASLDHVLFLLGWKAGARIGGIYGLDVDDISWDDNQLHFCHRPDQGTRLKNGENGERIVNLQAETMAVLEDYVEDVRFDVDDEYGRRPLFTTRNGRMHKNNLSKHIYYVTSPCQHGDPCPDGKDPVNCDYATGYSPSVECPHNTRPHDLRRGAILHLLRNEVPEKVVSERMNVSEKILSKHYDPRGEQERADQRRDWLEDM